MVRIVPGFGPARPRACFCGERPGKDEAVQGLPFVGKAGKVQRAHLSRHGVDIDGQYVTNLAKDFVPGNLDPTPEDIERWGPELVKELRRVHPEIIVAVGHHAIQFLVGEWAHLDAVHGMPQKCRLNGELGYSPPVIPIYHPAAGFYSADANQYIAYDYGRVAAAIKKQLPLEPAEDAYTDPFYRDGKLHTVDHMTEGMVVAMDTEGYPGDEWSFQIAGQEPGSGIVMRKSQPEFDSLLRRFVERMRGKTLVGHNLMYEFEMFRSLGVDLLDPALGIRFFDTMMAAYLLCIEPQSLKALARRWCGMEMKEYRETVGPAGLEKQLDYLSHVMDRMWPEPEERVKKSNDGAARVYKPQPVARRAEAILIDVYTEKKDKDGNLADPMKRWKKVDPELRRMVEREMGPMPIGTLADIPLQDALYYSGRDPDATMRVYWPLRAQLMAEGLTDLMDMKMAMLPAAAEMKINGMLARKSHFEWLAEEMEHEMEIAAADISKKYFGGRPFNPNSPDQVGALIRRRGLKVEKKTPTGKISTSKKSMEHLRFEDEAIEAIEQWRERSKVKDSFARPILEIFPEDEELHRIQYDLKITRVSSGRFAASNPNLMAIPVRTRLGLLVRGGFEAEEGYLIGGWDLDQIEMRVMADESGDERLIHLFEMAEKHPDDPRYDIHTDTASQIFRIDHADVDKMDHRYPAKRAGFGVITGIQDQGLLDQLRMAGCKGWTLGKVKKLREKWFEIYPGVARYMKRCKEECRDNGGVIQDRWGMPRYLPNIFSEDKYERWEAERQSHSHKIQGGAQGLIQRSMAWIFGKVKPYGDAVRWLLQLHDALYMEVMRGLEEEVERIIIEGMTEHGAKLRVPVSATGGFAKKWSEMKG